MSNRYKVTNKATGQFTAEGPTRTKQIKSSYTEAEGEQISAIAQAKGVSLAALQRLALLEYLKSQSK